MDTVVESNKVMQSEPEVKVKQHKLQHTERVVTMSRRFNNYYDQFTFTEDKNYLTELDKTLALLKSYIAAAELELQRLTKITGEIDG